MTDTPNVYHEDYTGPRWTYGFKYRPPGYAHQPKGFIIGSRGSHKDYPNFGTLDWPRELTADEVRSFELGFVRHYDGKLLDGSTESSLPPKQEDAAMTTQTVQTTTTVYEPQKEKAKGVWVHVGTECDGRWVKGFQTREAAEKSLRGYAMVETAEVLPTRAYHSDIGGSHYITQLKPGMSTDVYRRLLDAYDARETGTIKPAQTAFLAKWGW